jgi:hypothetical protein
MTVKMGASIKVNVWVSDPNTPLGDVEITAYSTNPSLLASDDIMIRGTGGERTLVFQPVVGVVGVTTVQVQVYDGVHTDTKGFRVEVSAPPADATRGELLATIPDGAKMECAVWGHPHVTMFSNLKYNFFGAGEFVYVHNETADSHFTVHAHAVPHGQSTVIDAVAVSTPDGTVKLFSDAEPVVNSPVFTLNTDVEDQTHITFPGGEKLEWAPHPNGLEGAAMRVVLPKADYYGTTKGLCGAIDYQAPTPLVTQDGATLHPSSSPSTIHAGFGMSWEAVEGSDHMPMFTSDEVDDAPMDFHPVYFPPFSSPELEHKADETCGPYAGSIKSGCKLDIALAGNHTWGAPAFARYYIVEDIADEVEALALSPKEACADCETDEEEECVVEPNERGLLVHLKANAMGVAPNAANGVDDCVATVVRGTVAHASGAGVGGGAVFMRGTGGYAVPALSEYDWQASVSVAMWFRSRNPTQTATLISNGFGARSSFEVSVENDGTLSAGVVTANHASPDNYAGIELRDDWNHVALTYDGSATLLYVNGYLQDGDSTASVGLLNQVAQPLYIGAAFGGRFEGLIDDVQVWDREIRQEEVIAQLTKGDHLLPEGWVDDVIAGRPSGSGSSSYHFSYSSTSQFFSSSTDGSYIEWSSSASASASDSEETSGAQHDMFAPRIDGLVDQLSEMGALVSVPFTLYDADTTLTDVKLTAFSSNKVFIPIENIQFSGAGRDRAVVVSPVAGVSGDVAITVEATDGQYVTRAHFMVHVTSCMCRTPSTESTGSVTCRGWGENHYATFSGVPYDFHGRGPFTIVNSGDLHVQACANELPGFSSGLTAVAIKTPMGSITVFMDGTVQDQDGNMIDSEQEFVDVELRFLDPEDPADPMRVTLLWPNDERVIISSVKGRLNFAVSLPREGYFDKTNGLCGSYNFLDGTPFKTPAGDLVDAESSTAELHFDFGLSWAVDEETDGSLFSFDDLTMGCPVDTEFLPELDPVFDTPELAEIALDACGELPGGMADACLYDVAQAGDIEAAESTLAAAKELKADMVGSAEGAPEIMALRDQATTEGMTVVIKAALLDPDTRLDSLVLTGSSSDQNVVPNDKILVDGAGQERDVVIFPKSAGNATIVLTVTDGLNSASETFVLVVEEVATEWSPPGGSAVCSLFGRAHIEQFGASIHTFEAVGEYNVIQSSQSDVQICQEAYDGTSQVAAFGMAKGDTRITMSGGQIRIDGEVWEENRWMGDGIELTRSASDDSVEIEEDTGEKYRLEPVLGGRFLNVLVKLPLPEYNDDTRGLCGVAGNPAAAGMFIDPSGDVIDTDVAGWGLGHAVPSGQGIIDYGAGGGCASASLIMHDILPFRRQLDTVLSANEDLFDCPIVEREAMELCYPVPGRRYQICLEDAASASNLEAATASVLSATATMEEELLLAISRAPALEGVPETLVAPAGAPVSVDLVLADSDTPIEDLDITISSSDESIVQSDAVQVVERDGRVYLVATPESGLSGDAEIQVTVSDGVYTTTQTMTVYVEDVCADGACVIPDPVTSSSSSSSNAGGGLTTPGDCLDGFEYHVEQAFGMGPGAFFAAIFVPLGFLILLLSVLLYLSCSGRIKIKCCIHKPSRKSSSIMPIMAGKKSDDPASPASVEKVFTVRNLHLALAEEQDEDQEEVQSPLPGTAAHDEPVEEEPVEEEPVVEDTTEEPEVTTSAAETEVDQSDAVSEAGTEAKKTKKKGKKGKKKKGKKKKKAIEADSAKVDEATEAEPVSEE